MKWARKTVFCHGGPSQNTRLAPQRRKMPCHKWSQFSRVDLCGGCPAALPMDKPRWFSQVQRQPLFGEGRRYLGRTDCTEEKMPSSGSCPHPDSGCPLRRKRLRLWQPLCSHEEERKTLDPQSCSTGPMRKLEWAGVQEGFLEELSLSQWVGVRQS